MLYDVVVPDCPLCLDAEDRIKIYIFCLSVEVLPFSRTPGKLPVIDRKIVNDPALWAGSFTEFSARYPQKISTGWSPLPRF